MIRKSFVVMVFAITAVFSTPLLAEYPERPINLIVPYKAGGGTDAYGRAIAAVAQSTIGVPVNVVNTPGSSGINGAKAAVRAPADGYNLMLTSAGSFLLTTLLKDTGLDALESFKIVAQVGQLRTSLMVPGNSPFKTAKDVIAAMKANPGKLRWGHTGRGGFHHIGGVGFLKKNGVTAQDVPFKGGGPARKALLGAQVDFAFIGVQQARGFEGRIRVLAVNSQDRDTIMNKVPSFGELRIPFAGVSSPVIVFAPKNTPKEIISKLQDGLKKITDQPKFAEVLLKRGTGPVFADSQKAKASLQNIKTDVAPLLVKK